jgi:peptidoglycan/xylan/chitin deacetylase (PgdA/CDA1 family)
VIRRLILVIAVLAIAGCGSSETTQTTPTTPPQISNGPPNTNPAQAPAASSKSGTPGAYKRVSTTPSHQAVPILMYHVIGTVKPGVAYPALWVSPTEFSDQVTKLQRAGYTAVTLDNVIDAWNGKAKLPDKPIVMTFDDGYIGQGKLAGPVLKQAGWPGVLYLVLHALGTPGGLTQSRIKTMISDGWEVGAHSLSHPDLTTLSGSALQHEIAGSRKVIQDKFGVPVNSFCYPAGKFNDAVEKAVKAAGYSSATTELPGAAKPTDDRFALPRIRINGGDSAATVLQKVNAAS